MSTIELPDVVTDVDMPRLREFAAQLRFAPLEGRIWLGDRRMVLLHGEAFASLRNELIASLGVEMARGLLTRIGYAAGCRDAELAFKTSQENPSMIDLIGSGSALHGLQGFVRVERVGSGRTDQTGNMRLEWIWRDSIECEGHLATHGVGPYSACWTEVGYSSGYLSTCAGRRILVREVECRSLGHAECRSVAKPVGDWTDAEEDLRFLEPQPAPATRVYGGFSQDPATKADPRVDSGRQPVAKTAPGGNSGIVGASAAFNVLRHNILRVAPTNATVLLLGESGVGKSLFAREVHRNSQRAALPFVEVNCAAIPEQLVESELFGVERGAFSGAVSSRTGRFEAAAGGTIFLDEIATLSFTAQGKLLRVLQNGEIERLGSNKTIRPDVRIIAATNENLSAAVQEGRFREDLFFRLNVFPLLIPPLRDRRDDIPLLTERMLARFSALHGRDVAGITSRAMQAMMGHGWPGNIRELENVLERGVILAQDGDLIDLHHLFSVDSRLASIATATGLSSISVPSTALADADATNDAPPRSADATSSESLDLLAERIIQQGSTSLADVEDAWVRAAVKQAGGNISRAATLLGMTRAQVDYRVKKSRP